MGGSRVGPKTRGSMGRAFVFREGEGSWGALSGVDSVGREARPRGIMERAFVSRGKRGGKEDSDLDSERKALSTETQDSLCGLWTL